MRIRRKDGTYVWHLVRAEPLLNAAGDVELVVGTCTDISEGQRMQEALARSKGELEAIIGGVDEGISAQDAAGRLIYSNLKFARISGYDSPEESPYSPLIRSRGPVRDVRRIREPHRLRKCAWPARPEGRGFRIADHAL